MKKVISLRWFLIIIILSVASLTAFYLVTNSSRNVSYMPVEIAKKGIDLIMRRVRLVEKKGGQKE